MLSTTIAGNFVGAYDATVDLGNTGDGIQIVSGAKNSTLGGSSSVPLLISDNGGYGIFIRDVGTNDTTISNWTFVGLNYAENASLGKVVMACLLGTVLLVPRFREVLCELLVIMMSVFVSPISAQWYSDQWCPDRDCAKPQSERQSCPATLQQRRRCFDRQRPAEYQSDRQYHLR
ncbi:MAG: hypothetical protein HC828_22305 [Blastochloris sp.]|nr:hypothetical protein [Blastochloris sp.]